MIAAGETFYTHNLGIPELRDALSVYLRGLHKGFQPREAVVTSAGVIALMLATQLLVDPGERVVEVVPLWPNLQEIPRILGAHVDTVALRFSASGWTLDLDELIQKLEPGTRALYLNSPNNPTGWTVTRDEQRAILAPGLAGGARGTICGPGQADRIQHLLRTRIRAARRGRRT